MVEVDSNQIIEDTETKSRTSEGDALWASFDIKNPIKDRHSEVTKREIARSYYKLGKLHYDKADLLESEKHFTGALQLAEMPRDGFTILKTLGFLLRINSEKMQGDLALQFILKTEQTLEQLAASLGSLNAEYFYNLALLKTYRGEFPLAKENFNLSLNKAREENDPDLQAKCLLALASNAFSAKNYEVALEHVNHLSQLLKIINKNYLSGSMHLFAAKVYLEMGVLDKAELSFIDANHCLQEKKSWNLYGYILLGRGICCKRKGEYDKALTYFNLAQESVDLKNFKRLSQLLENEIQDVNDSSIDMYMDRTHRNIHERHLGTIDFKHRFVLLEILFLLAKNPGVYYDKEQLAKSIWKDEYNPLIHDKLIYTSVSRLRKLIEPKGAGRRKYIMRGKDGYTFNPAVKIRFHVETRTAVDKTIANIELGSPV